MKDLDTLYHQFNVDYNKWAEVERPKDELTSFNESSLLFMKGIRKLASFRDNEWNQYVKSRDAYFKAYKELGTH